MVSVIIVNHKSEDYLRACLKSLFLQEKEPMEVIVIANEGVPLPFLQREFPQITLLLNSRPRGFAANVNRGLIQARGKVLILLNPDTELKNPVVSLLASYLETHPDTAVAGPKIFNSDGNLQPSCRSFPTFGAALARHTPLEKLKPGAAAVRKYLMAHASKDQPLKVDWVSGACMAISRKALEDIGFFDERFTMYLEDVDFCYRARKKGWEVVYFPEAQLIHHGHGSTGKNPYRNILRHHYSMILYVKKHHLVPSYCLPLVYLGAACRSLFALLHHAYAQYRNLF